MTTNTSDTNSRIISNLLNQYNADNDIIPNAPRILYTEWKILTVLINQQLQINELEDQIKKLQNKG